MECLGKLIISEKMFIHYIGFYFLFQNLRKSDVSGQLTQYSSNRSVLGKNNSSCGLTIKEAAKFLLFKNLFNKIYKNQLDIP